MLFDEELVLLGEDGAPFLDPNKPKAYLIDGPSWVNNHAHVLRARSATSNRFLKHQFDAVNYASHVNGTTRLKLTQGAMREIPFALPPTREQERIVAAIEEHLSHLDAGTRPLDAAEVRIDSLERAAVGRLWQEPCAQRPLGDLADVIAGPAFKSDQFVREGEGVRLLRGDNIEPGSLRWRDARCWPRNQLTGLDGLYIDEEDLILAMDRPLISSGLKLARVRRSDLPALLVQRVARIRSRGEIDSPLLFRFLQHASVSAQLVGGQTGTQVPHVSLSAIRSIEVPIARPDRQRELGAWIEEVFAATARLRHAAVTARGRASSLRRSILAAAFAGKLVPQDPSDEPASALLDRIRAEQEAAGLRRRSRS